MGTVRLCVKCPGSEIILPDIELTFSELEIPGLEAQKGAWGWGWGCLMECVQRAELDRHWTLHSICA